MSKARCPRCDGYAPYIDGKEENGQQCDDCGYVLTISDSCPQGPCYNCEYYECAAKKEHRG